MIMTSKWKGPPYRRGREALEGWGSVDLDVSLFHVVEQGGSLASRGQILTDRHAVLIDFPLVPGHGPFALRILIHEQSDDLVLGESSSAGGLRRALLDLLLLLLRHLDPPRPLGLGCLRLLDGL